MATEKDSRVDLRRKGSYLVTGGLLFALYWALNLNDALMGALLLILGLVYALTERETETTSQPAPLKRIARVLVIFVGLVSAVTIASLFIVWLSQIISIPISLLTAAAFMLAGLMLIAWSYRK